MFFVSLESSWQGEVHGLWFFVSLESSWQGEVPGLGSLCLWKALDKERCMGLVLCVFGKLLTRRGAWAWFYDIWTCSAKVPRYWMISSLKIKLNRSWKFRRIWIVPLVFLKRSWWGGFNGIYLVRFGFRMWEILSFKWSLPLKIQINSKKPGFGRTNHLRTW